MPRWHTKYLVGDEAEIDVKDEGWIKGIIQYKALSPSVNTIVLKLHDGRIASCTSSKCIRLLK